MASDTDSKQRLDTIEANLTELRTAIQALVHAQLRETPGTTSATGQEAAGAWIAGELQAMAAGREGEVAGYAAASDPHNSVTWCYSRYFCTTMMCGGSSWC